MIVVALATTAVVAEVSENVTGGNCSGSGKRRSDGVGAKGGFCGKDYAS